MRHPGSGCWYFETLMLVFSVSLFLSFVITSLLKLADRTLIRIILRVFVIIHKLVIALFFDNASIFVAGQLNDILAREHLLAANWTSPLCVLKSCKFDKTFAEASPELIRISFGISINK